MLCNSFYKTIISLIPKHAGDTAKTEKFRSIPLMNTDEKILNIKFKNTLKRLSQPSWFRIRDTELLQHTKISTFNMFYSYTSEQKSQDNLVRWRKKHLKKFSMLL